MTSRFDGYNWVIVLERDELLIENLNKFAKDNKIKGGFLTGLGGAQWAELGFYHLDKQDYAWLKVNQLMEITGLFGNLAWKDDQPIWHLHGTFTDSHMQALGGHIKELQVGGTVELFLHVIISGGLERKHSDKVGLDLIDL